MSRPVSPSAPSHIPEMDGTGVPISSSPTIVPEQRPIITAPQNVSSTHRANGQENVPMPSASSFHPRSPPPPYNGLPQRQSPIRHQVAANAFRPQSREAPIPASTHQFPILSSSNPPPSNLTIISSTSPFHLQLGNVHTTFEIDHDARGSIVIGGDEAAETPTAPPIDVGGLNEGAVLRFENRRDDDSIVLNLQYSNGCSRRITLRWLRREE